MVCISEDILESTVYDNIRQIPADGMNADDFVDNIMQDLFGEECWEEVDDNIMNIQQEVWDFIGFLDEQGVIPCESCDGYTFSYDMEDGMVYLEKDVDNSDFFEY